METQENKSLGVQVINSVYQIICEFLGKPYSEAIQDFTYFSRRMHNCLQNEIVKKVSQDYEKIKNKGPMQFIYNEKVLWDCLDYFTQFGNEKILMKLVVPSSYFNLGQNICNKEVYKYYLRIFNHYGKQEKLNIFKNYIIRWNNWETFTSEIEKILPLAKSPKKKGKKKTKTHKPEFLTPKFTKELLLLKSFITDNIYSFKKEAFEESYISFLKKHELR